MDPVLARIDEWQQAGLLDAPTAARLRTREGERQADAGRQATRTDGGRPTNRAVSATDILGPAPTVAEMFGYLGAIFLLGAWTAFVGKTASADGLAVSSGGLLVAAVVLAVVGLVLRSGDDRRRRAAGIAFLTATGYAVAGVSGLLGSASVYGPPAQLIVALLAVAIAAAIRFIHAGLLTQFAVLVSTTAFAAALLGWLNDVVQPDYTEKGVPIGQTPDAILLISVNAAVWLLLALGLGVLAIQESAARRDSLSAPGAPGRRAALTRAWAGTVAVVGLASALTRSDLLASGDYGRVVPAWVMEVLLLALAALLVERAFRRDSSAFLFAAGIGLIAALSDFNFTYLSNSTETGLLIEGVLLLVVGFGADRLRRRLSGRPGGSPPASGAPLPEPQVEASPGV